MTRRKGNRSSMPPVLYVHICTACGEPFESSELDRTRCYVCPPHRGWRSDVCWYDDHDANKKADRPEGNQ